MRDVVFNALLGEWDRSEPTGTLDKRNFEGEKELSNGEAVACGDETVPVAVDDAATDVDASFS